MNRKIQNQEELIHSGNKIIKDNIKNNYLGGL